jgi:hypothetical protein
MKAINIWSFWRVSDTDAVNTVFAMDLHLVFDCFLRLVVMLMLLLFKVI